LLDACHMTAGPKLVLLTLSIAAGCYADARAGYPGVEGPSVCDYYGPYGPRSSYYDAPGYGYAYGYAAIPNDHPYLYGGPTLVYGGGPVLYGPMPPGRCPPAK
jgi:hypothetical protein